MQFSVILRSSVESKYRKLNQRDHILKRPDMYVGTVHPVQGDWWLYDAESKKMEYANVQYVPALQKIFDEIIVNAADNKVRQKDRQTYVRVTVDPITGWISVTNDGDGIPVKMHKEYKMWVPELIFGNLLTSSNYNDSERRVTGGCYGYGAKLTNIFSKHFQVETYDSVNNRKFVMEWTQNMKHRGEPTITNDFSSKPLEMRRPMGYTKISFLPDYPLLNVPDGLTADMQRILYRRVLDLCGIMGQSMGVYFNDAPIAIETFEQYAQLYPIDRATIVHQKDKRWDMTVGMSKDEKFHGISFVNSAFVTNNGTHVKFVLDEIIQAVREAIHAADPSLRARHDMIKNHLFLFINCQIENPQFDSQQKQELKSLPAKFGSYPKVKDFAAKIVRETNLVNIVINELNRKFICKVQPAGGSRHSMLCIPKLEDATLAGTSESEKCTLIITEGDSAKALAVSGLNVVGRAHYGVFPVRGKPLNIRGVSKKQIADCKEVMSILRILGISLDSSAPQKLRYGKVMIMADQDIDGVHIKGLLCNLFQVIAPHLFKQSGFLSQFITPLVKVSGPKKFEKSFYSVNEAKKFMGSIPPETAKQFRTKYYKGLGTSTAAEAQEYFSHIKENTIEFAYDPETDEHCLEIPFGKQSAADRKAWIADRPSTALEEEFDFSVRQITYHDFVNKQLIQYSLSDCARTLPNYIDGFKTTQRKILHGALQRDLSSSIKVQELAGYISEHCGYYHGDASLTGAIIRMAQDYVGSNNVPLLYPEGQFGTRMDNGSDSAAARYIFTKLGRLTKYIFREEDAENLEYAQSEGKRIEPLFFVPIVPMALVNGSKGIATGYSTIIPPHSIRDLIASIREKLDDKTCTRALMPFYEGFQGKVKKAGDGYQTIGAWELMSAHCIRIKEIPTCYSIHDIKAHLSALYELGVISLFEEHHSIDTIDFDIYCHPQIISALVRTNMVHRLFKLVSPMTNIQLSCLDGSKIRVFKTVKEIFDQFYGVRMHYYTLRKASQLKRLHHSQQIMQNRQRFLKKLLDRSFVLPDDPKEAPALMAKCKFDVHPHEKSYAYLLDQRISVLTRANLVNLQKRLEANANAIATLKQLSEKDLWLKDLAALETELGRGGQAKTTSRERKVKEINALALSQPALDYVRKAILAHGNRK